MDWNNNMNYGNRMNNWPNGNNNMSNMNDSGPKPITLNTLPVNNSNKNQNGTPQCIPGRVIHDVSDVAPNEVPMDNTYATFIKDDYSEIYLKTWNAEGTKIDTLKFVLATNDTVQNNQNNDVDLILKKLEPIEDISKRLERVEQKVNGIRYYKPKTKGGNINA